MSSKPFKLETERLVLRNIRASDWQDIQEYASDPGVVKFMFWGPNTEAETREFVRRVIKSRRQKIRTAWDVALVEKNLNRLIGAGGLYIRSPQNREGEIGYVLNRLYWNQGYVTEAAGRLLTFAFEELGLQRIFATCDPDNSGSYRVMEKIGMQREGRLRGNKLIKGVWRDSLVYGILREDWEKRKRPAEKTGSRIEYQTYSLEGLDLIHSLWEKLRDRHKGVSEYFVEHYDKMNFDLRKDQLLKKSTGGALKIDLAFDLSKQKYAGYCVTSVDARNQGEIESIYVENEYRAQGIGDSLMKRALTWLDTLGVTKKTLVVAGGNENVFRFYSRFAFYPARTVLEQKEGIFMNKKEDK